MSGPEKVERETCEHCQYKGLPVDATAALPGLPMIVRMSAALRFITVRFGI